jgi:hypothetical protein
MPGKASQNRRLAGVGVIAASAVGLFASAAAFTPSAGAVSFDCGPIAAQTWCIYNVRHSYYTANAYYSGISVCAKLIRDADGGLISQMCGGTSAVTGAAGTELAKPLVKNDASSGSFTVLGGAAY